jgi:hypothetical protein
MRKLGLFPRGFSCGAPVNSRSYGGGCGVGVNSGTRVDTGTGGRGTITRGMVGNNVTFKQKSMATGGGSWNIQNSKEMINRQPPIELTSHLPFHTSTETTEYHPAIATEPSNMALHKPHWYSPPESTYIFQEARSNDRDILQSWISGNSLTNKKVPELTGTELTHGSSQFNTNFTSQGSGANERHRRDQLKVSEYANYHPFVKEENVSTQKFQNNNIQHPEIRQIPLNRIYIDKPMQQNIPDEKRKHHHESGKIRHEPPVATQVSFKKSQSVPQFTSQVLNTPSICLPQVRENSKNIHSNYDNPNTEHALTQRRTMRQLEASQSQPLIKEYPYVHSPQPYELQHPNIEKKIPKDEVQLKKPIQQNFSQ